MNEITGYYSCSINPNYISTWYTSLLPKRNNKQLSMYLNSVPDFVSEVSLPQSESTGFEDLVISPPVRQVPVNLADNSHKGRISPVAFRKIKKAIDYTVYLAAPKHSPDNFNGKAFKFRLNLITLTLSSSQVHSDKIIKNEIFQPMLNSFRKKYGVINYVWRAEKQGNDNIHFHIVTDKFIPWNELRNEWNKFQNHLGYIDRYRQNMLDFHKAGFQERKNLFKAWPLSDQIKAFKEGIKNNWSNPNSSDVHSLRNVSNVKQYFVKYLTKDEQSADSRIKVNPDGVVPGSVVKSQYSNLEGRLWGCSSNLANIKGARADLDAGLTEELQKLKLDTSIHHFDSDFFSVSFIDIELLKKQGYKLIVSIFEEFIKLSFPEYRPANLFS